MYGRLDLKNRIGNGETVVGSWVQLASPEVAEIASASGFDFVCVDMEHGSFGIDRLPDIIRGVEVGGAACIVRIPDDSRSTVLKVLDAGAAGILVPNLGSAEQAKRVASYARYAPAGVRGACPRVRATGHNARDWRRESAEADRGILLWGIIETREGVENFDGILQEPGFDGLTFGPFDLAQDLGFEGDYESPQVVDLVAKMRAQARDSDKHLIEVVFGFDQASVRAAVEDLSRQGIRIFMCGTDRRILTTSYRNIAGWLRNTS